VPVEFLSDSQVARYRCFAGEFRPRKLEQFFRLSEADRIVVEGRHLAHNWLGYAVQLGTVRMLGTFLASPADVPVSVVKFAAEQLKIADLPVARPAALEARRRRSSCGTSAVVTATGISPRRTTNSGHLWRRGQGRR
jgi:TnpA family transposase